MLNLRGGEEELRRVRGGLFGPVGCPSTPVADSRIGLPVWKQISTEITCACEPARRAKMRTYPHVPGRTGPGLEGRSGRTPSSGSARQTHLFCFPLSPHDSLRPDDLEQRRWGRFRSLRSSRSSSRPVERTDLQATSLDPFHNVCVEVGHRQNGRSNGKASAQLSAAPPPEVVAQSSSRAAHLARAADALRRKA